MKKRVTKIQKSVKPTVEFLSNVAYLAKKVFLMM